MSTKSEKEYMKRNQMPKNTGAAIAKIDVGVYDPRDAQPNTRGEMSGKPTVEEIIENIQEQIKMGRGRHDNEIFLLQDEANIFLKAIREMQELLKMVSELSWAIGQDDVGKDWEELGKLEERLHKFHKPSWMHQPKDNGIDLTHLPKGKPTAYSEGGPAR